MSTEPSNSKLRHLYEWANRAENYDVFKSGAEEILANYVSKEELRAAIDNLNNPGEYEDWGTYGEGFAACQAELRKQFLEEGK